MLVLTRKGGRRLSYLLLLLALTSSAVSIPSSSIGVGVHNLSVEKLNSTLWKIELVRGNYGFLTLSNISVTHQPSIKIAGMNTEAVYVKVSGEEPSEYVIALSGNFSWTTINLPASMSGKVFSLKLLLYGKANLTSVLLDIADLSRSVLSSEEDTLEKWLEVVWSEGYPEEIELLDSRRTCYFSIDKEESPLKVLFFTVFSSILVIGVLFLIKISYSIYDDPPKVLKAMLPLPLLGCFLLIFQMLEVSFLSEMVSVVLLIYVLLVAIISRRS